MSGITYVRFFILYIVIVTLYGRNSHFIIRIKYYIGYNNKQLGCHHDGEVAISIGDTHKQYSPPTNDSSDVVLQ